MLRHSGVRWRQGENIVMKSLVVMLMLLAVALTTCAGPAAKQDKRAYTIGYMKALVARVNAEAKG